MSDVWRHILYFPCQAAGTDKEKRHQNTKAGLSPRKTTKTTAATLIFRWLFLLSRIPAKKQQDLAKVAAATAAATAKFFHQLHLLSRKSSIEAAKRRNNNSNNK